jgi:deazaflavin-dependent oxidoreductase (nitroreductase family)
MSEEQKSEAFETPERDTIVASMREHVAAMEQSDDEEAWIAAGMHHLLLRTIGRRSGEERKVALPFWKDADGRLIVVASYSGAPNHPAWYANLADRDANPEVLCRIRQRRFWADTEILDGDEYASVWESLTADRPFYRDYQALTQRRIPLVALIETRPA